MNSLIELKKLISRSKLKKTLDLGTFVAKFDCESFVSML